MLIYRVETEEGAGPWARKNETRPHGYDWHAEGSRCFPDQIGSMFGASYFDHPHKKHMIYGFPDIPAMFKYVKHRPVTFEKIFSYFKDMEQKQLLISTYNVESGDVISDSNQCVFLPEKAKLVNRVKPTSPIIQEWLTEYCNGRL